MTVLPLNIDFPSVEERLLESTESWIRDLRSLYENAQNRFGDISWEALGSSERIWAIIYARAPKAFKDRYFQSTVNYQKPSRVPSPYLLNSLPDLPSKALEPLAISVYSTISQTSLITLNGEFTQQDAEVNVLQLLDDETPELFKSQLEWLYTSEGLGDVVQWIDVESHDESGLEASKISSIDGDLQNRRDKLGQDLTYMWRSKLYSDVRIHLTSEDPLPCDPNDSDNSTDSLSATAVFSSHGCILASRSPYFASVLLNTSSFLPPSSDIHLPIPPFTPASLHFCLGYIYAGHLNFSNRTFDLTTAFHIHRAATYLQLDSLVNEIESRIVHDFCHGLEWDSCRCKKCLARAPRVWKYVLSGDVNALTLEHRAKLFLVRSWEQSWGKEIGTADEDARQDLTIAVKETIKPASVISTLKAIKIARIRIENMMRISREGESTWIDNVIQMIDEIERKAYYVLQYQFPAVACAEEFVDLLHDHSMSLDLLEETMDRVVNATSTVEGFSSAPIIYQTLMTTIQSKLDENSIHHDVSPRSRIRIIMGQVRNKLVENINHRWELMTDHGDPIFRSLEPWVLQELSDGVNVNQLVGSERNRASRIVPHTTSRSGPNTYGTLSKSRDNHLKGRTTTTDNSKLPRDHSGGLKRLRLPSAVSSISTRSNHYRESMRIANDPDNIAPRLTPSPGTSSKTSVSRHGPLNAVTPQRRTPGDGISNNAILPSRIHSNTSAPSSVVATSSSTSRPIRQSPFTGTTQTSLQPKRVTDKRTLFPSSHQHSNSISDSNSKSNSSSNSGSNGYSKNISITPSSSSSLRSRARSNIIERTPITPKVNTRSRLNTLTPTPSSGKSEKQIRLKSSISSFVHHSNENAIENINNDTMIKRSKPIIKTSFSPSTALSQLNLNLNTIKKNDKFENDKDQIKIWDGPGIILNESIPCIVVHDKSRNRFQGNIRYIGHMKGSKGPWIGIESINLNKFQNNSKNENKNKIENEILLNGIKDGILYFQKSKTKQINNKNLKINNGLNRRDRRNFNKSNQDQDQINYGNNDINNDDDKYNDNDNDDDDLIKVIFVRPKEIVFIMT
ncbi:uncharacterized protein I206_101559 [Kwoniella pini CBS 10737]|uniref:BTB domain-containing protein n=1 Tax=Kwoniella pini CBS 10737 TaxID=1296096 RepID=A0AAJ8L028_9TREE